MVLEAPIYAPLPRLHLVTKLRNIACARRSTPARTRADVGARGTVDLAHFLFAADGPDVAFEYVRSRLGVCLPGTGVQSTVRERSGTLLAVRYFGIMDKTFRLAPTLFFSII